MTPVEIQLVKLIDGLLVPKGKFMTVAMVASYRGDDGEMHLAKAAAMASDLSYMTSKDLAKGLVMTIEQLHGMADHLQRQIDTHDFSKVKLVNPDEL